MKRLESALGYIAFALFTSTGVLALFVIVTLIVRGPAELPEFVSTASARTTGTESAAETEGGPDLGTAAAAAAASDAAPAQAAAAPAATLDLAAGEKVFKKCASCHTIDKGGANRVGPNLWGVVNRSTAHAEGFKYSDAMLSHDAETWTPEHLDEYLAKPRDVIAGTTMSFAGLPKPEDRHNLIAWMAAQSDSPVAAETLPFAIAAATTTETATDATAEAPADTPADTAEAPATDTAEADSGEPAQIPHTDPPGSDADDFSVIAARIAALTADSRAMDYERARFHPIHFPPQIETATNGECLTCHQEVLDHQVRAESPAGLKADEALAWYQTLDTYVPEAGTGQSDFHWRHLDSPLAQKVMNLQCNFCHRGNDPREESPDMMPLRAAFSADPATPEFTDPAAEPRRVALHPACRLPAAGGADDRAAAAGGLRGHRDRGARRARRTADRGPAARARRGPAAASHPRGGCPGGALAGHGHRRDAGDGPRDRRALRLPEPLSADADAAGSPPQAPVIPGSSSRRTRASSSP